MSENQSPPTATYYDFVKKLFNRSGDISKDFCHAILGIVTEIHEYQHSTDETNGLEELGDLEFYVVALAQVLEDHTGLFITPGINEMLAHFNTRARLTSPDEVISDLTTQMLDSAKRWVGYGKEPESPVEVYAAVVTLVMFVNLTGPYPNENPEAIMRANMAKLLKRYPGGEFDAFRAVNRDLESELVALQTA